MREAQKGPPANIAKVLERKKQDTGVAEDFAEWIPQKGTFHPTRSRQHFFVYPITLLVISSSRRPSPEVSDQTLS
jgi:hypothetical protein